MSSILYVTNICIFFYCGIRNKKELRQIMGILNLTTSQNSDKTKSKEYVHLTGHRQLIKRLLNEILSFQGNFLFITLLSKIVP
jgi:hypothetical protein